MEYDNNHFIIASRAYSLQKHGLIDLNNIEFPLFLLEFLKLYLYCLPMLFALRFHDLSFYKTIFHSDEGLTRQMS
jgi:hypothetical protein